MTYRSLLVHKTPDPQGDARIAMPCHLAKRCCPSLRPQSSHAAVNPAVAVVCMVRPILTVPPVPRMWDRRWLSGGRCLWTQTPEAVHRRRGQANRDRELPCRIADVALTGG